MTRIVVDKSISLVLLLKIGCLFGLCGVLPLVLLPVAVVGFIKVVLVGVLYPGYCGSPVMAQQLRYNCLLQQQHGWRPIYLVPEMA
jgi:hypothetical protein